MTPERQAVAMGLLRFAPLGHPFPGRSGGSPMWVAIDTRGAGMNLPLRQLLVQRLVGLIEQVGPDVVCGVGKSGIVWGGICAWLTGRGYATVLPDGARRAGLQRAVEGDVRGKRAVLLDNVLDSGETLRRCAAHLRDAGADVLGSVVIVRRGHGQSVEAVYAVFEFNALLQTAHSTGLCSDSVFNLIQGSPS